MCEQKANSNGQTVVAPLETVKKRHLLPELNSILAFQESPEEKAGSAPSYFPFL